MMWGIVMKQVVSTLHNDMLSSDSVYRVQIPKDRKYITTICIGIECVDKELNNCYHSINDLPNWLQGKIAILMLCDLDEDIKGVGRRVREDIFYIYR